MSKRRRRPLRPAPKPGPPPAARNPNEPKFPIRRIELLGVTRLSRQQVRAIVSPYENRSLGASDLNALLEALTRAYVTRGYLTTRVYLPEQDLRTGTLKLQVLEGRLAVFSTGPTIRQDQLFTAFPTQPGAIIRLSDLEQGMDQLERPPSLRARSELVPGPREGTSILALPATQTFPGHLSLGVDNFGLPVTGEWR